MEWKEVKTRAWHRANDPLIPVLRGMALDETRSWDSKRRFTVNAAKWRVEQLEGKKFIQRTVDGKIYVTRIK